MVQRVDPETGDKLTEHQWQAICRDAKLRLTERETELNKELQRAKNLGIDVQVAVDEEEEPIVVRRDPKVVEMPRPAKRYPQVRVTCKP